MGITERCCSVKCRSFELRRLRVLLGLLSEIGTRVGELDSSRDSRRYFGTCDSVATLRLTYDLRLAQMLKL